MNVLKWFDFGIFPGMCMFSIGYKYTELMTELRKRSRNDRDWHRAMDGDEELFEGAQYIALSKTMEDTNTGERSYYYYIVIDSFDFSDYDFCRLAHECLHICQFFLPRALDRNKEHEAECYLHTHIMRKCLQIMRDEQKRIEKTNAKNVRP